MNLLNSIKSMLQAIGSKTASDKANKGVMLVKTNGDSAGEPAGYVTKEVLAEIVRQELFSILNNGDNEATTLSKFIGLDGSSMKSITANNLASVLGALEHATVRDNTTSFDDLPEGSIRLIGTRNEGRPDGTEGSLLVCITFFRPTATSGGGLIQVAFKWLGSSATAMTIYVRQTNGDGIFCPWNTLSLT